MTIRSWTRSVEKRFLRPLGRLLLRLRGRSSNGRVDHLERRIAELEGLVRELTGLVYLQLDQPGDAPVRPRAGGTREAA